MSTTFETFGKYILLEKIAAGGMAEVFLAKTTGAGGISKFVAIKRILPHLSGNPEFIKMFKEEAKIAVNLNHGNVVSIFDFGVEKLNFFLVMEYVEGQNLRQVLNHLKKDGRSFTIDQILYIIKEVAAGLDHAHRCLDGTTGRPLNIIHRDMSPQNIMISFEGEVKIVDFGIAKAESQSEVTRAGTIKGKFGYMSPEQADGQLVDLRTDIFSLGIILWELLANDRLFISNSEAGTLRKVRECQIPSIRKINSSIPLELEKIVNKALTKNNDLRYLTAASFHRDLNIFLNTQYPEFSAQEFSLFMKSSFSQMFVENRKKLMEFARATALDDRTVLSITVSETPFDKNQDLKKNQISVNLSESPASKNTPVSKIDFSDLENKNKALGRKVSSNVISKSENKTRRTPIQKNPDFTKSDQQQIQSISLFSTALFLLAASAGLIFYLHTQGNFSFTPLKNTISEWCNSFAFLKNNCPINFVQNSSDIPNGVNNIASTAKSYIDVSINSDPIGAKIIIDGENTALITPAIKKLEEDKIITLSLQYENYVTPNSLHQISKNTNDIKINLIPISKRAYIILNLINGGNAPLVYVDNLRVEVKSQTPTLIPIPAERPIKIQATDPFSKNSAEQTITVLIDQKQELNLILTSSD